MSPRQRQALSFGAGVDRASGAMVADPSMFGDLRNVALSNGRLELRKGASRSLLLDAGTDLLGVWPIRAQAVAAAIVFDAATGDVLLYNVDATGTIAVFVDVLWTLPDGAVTPPVIECADAYDKLTIAHAEPIFGYRQATRVYDPIAGTLDVLQADFQRSGTLHDVKFFGVARHLAYMLGWGYGQFGDEDRGEVLRISMPGEPTNFVPEHYFLVGARGDPIVGGGLCNGEFALMKAGSGYKLVGYDRASFGIRPLDPSYGMIAPRLHATVNDEFHFWSESGPRYSTGGASGDLASPLDLDGELPDPLAGEVDRDKGFCYYDPIARQVIYVFGRWGYVLHLRDGQRRWSYNRYGIPLAGAGKLYIGGVATLVVPIEPVAGGASYAAPAYTESDSFGRITIPWTLAGTPSGVEQVEVWVKASSAATWTRLAIVAAGALTATVRVPEFLTTYQVALRCTIGGLPGVGYTSTNPATWPAAARTTITTGGDIADWTLSTWHRFDAVTQGFDTLMVGPGIGQPDNGSAHLTYRIEKSSDGGATFDPHTTGHTAYDPIGFTNGESLTRYIIRARAEGPDAVGAWRELPEVAVAPEAPLYVLVSAQTGGAFGGHDAHDVSWAPPQSATTGPADHDGPFEVQGRHRSFGIDGAWSATSDVPAGTHDITDYAVSIGGTGLPRTADVRVRVKSGADVSEWTIGSPAAEDDA